jgi:hypothetical protein
MCITEWSLTCRNVSKHPPNEIALLMWLNALRELAYADLYIFRYMGSLIGHQILEQLCFWSACTLNKAGD